MPSQNHSRSIIITGANNGIGLAMTQALLQMGDRVAALDLSLDHLDLTPLRQVEGGTPNLLPFQCDVTDPQQIQVAVDEVLRKWGRRGCSH